MFPDRRAGSYAVDPMRVALMVEGQEDVTWEQWRAIAAAAEAAGLDTLLRSDHYSSVVGDTTRGGDDAWTSLAALAAVTSRIRLGTLVSPVTFRHPALLAKAVVTADHISGGRVELGLGAGWHRPEHEGWGFEFPPVAERMERLAEQLEIVTAMWSPGRVDFEGRHYRIRDLEPLPAPVQKPRPPILVGGSGGPRTLGLAAAHADEYNTVSAGPEECAARRAALTASCKRVRRAPDTIRFSMMATCVLGRDDAEVAERIGAAAARMRVGDAAEFAARERQRGVVGTIGEARARLREYASAGVDRVMLRNVCHDDLDMITLIGELHEEVRT